MPHDPTPPLPPQLLARARQRYGLVVLSDFDDVGFDRAHLLRLVRRGDCRVVRQGVISLGRLDKRPHAVLRERALAALLLLPAGTMACASTASAFWRLDDPEADDDLVHVLLPPGVRQHPMRGVKLHQSAVGCEAVVVDDVPCTDLPRTLLDRCAKLPLAVAVAMLDAAERADPGALRLCRMQMGQCGRRGHLRVAGALRLATGQAESTLESIAWVLWHSAGLPPPLMQAVIRRAGRFLARVDFLWPDAMLVVEVDGLGKYAEPGELQREKARQNLLVAAGYVVLRFTWADVVHRPEDVARQIRATLMINT